MSAFVVASDSHLELFTWATRPEIQFDSFYSFDQTIKHCVERKLNLVLPGDVHDSRHPESMEISMFSAGVIAMRNAGLKIFVIQGQHDYSVPAWPVASKWEDTVEWVNGRQFKPMADSDFTLYGLDYRKPDEIAEALAKVPDTVNGLVMHQMAKEAMPIEGSYDFDGTMIPMWIALLVLGDYHIPLDFQLPTGGLGFYTGSQHVKSVAEPKKKSFVEVGVSKVGLKWAFSLQRIPLKTRVYVEVTVNTPEELDQLVKNVELADFDKLVDDVGIERTAPVRRPVILLRYLVNIPSVLSRVKNALGDRAILWPLPQKPAIVSGSNVEARPAKGATLETCLARFAQPETDSYIFTLDLLKSPAPTVFERWRKKFGVTAPV